MLRVPRTRWINVFLLALALFSFFSRLPSLRLGLPPHIFVDEIFFFDDVYRHLKDSIFYPQSFISGAMNELPMWFVGHVLHLLGIEFSYPDFLVLGRLLLPILLTSITVFPLYLLSLRVNKNEKAALASVILFVFSPWVFSNSQLWYPDHYIYFFVCLYLLQLVNLWERNFSPTLPYSLGVSLAVLMSVKYTAFIYVIPLFLAAKFVKVNKQFPRKFIQKNALKSIYISILAFAVINFSIFRYFHGFLQGMNSNRKNYRFLTSLPFRNLLAYSELLFVFGLGFIGLLLVILGIKELERNKNKLIRIFLVTIFVYLIFISTSPIMVPRNINLLIPLLSVIAGAGIGFFTRVLNRSRLLSFLTFFAVTSLLIPTVISYSESYREIRKTESLDLVKKFVMRNIPPGSVVGTNPGSDGLTPIETINFSSVPDPQMKLTLDYYVFSSFWESPVRQYFYVNGYFNSWSSRNFHFDESSASSAFQIKPPNRNLEDFIPSGYRIIKVITSVGPTYVVLARNTK
jgi:hypothetical protein